MVVRFTQKIELSDLVVRVATDKDGKLALDVLSSKGFQICKGHPLAHAPDFEAELLAALTPFGVEIDGAPAASSARARVAELEAELEEQGGWYKRAESKVLALERELEDLRRAYAVKLAAPPEQLQIAAALVSGPELDAELEDIAARINRDELVALTELRTFVEGCAFRRLDGELERAYERANELIGMATDDTPFVPERRTGR